MADADEDVIVIASDEPEPDVAGSVEVIVEGEPGEAESRSGLEGALEDVEPMPAMQRGVLIAVAIIIVAGIGLLVAYWNGLLGV